MTIITDETKRTRNHQNAGKECEKVGQAGRVPDGGIKLQYSVYHSFVWRDRCTGIGGSHMDHHGHYHGRFPGLGPRFKGQKDKWKTGSFRKRIFVFISLFRIFIEEGKDYIPYLITVVIYIAIANMIGLLGFKSPTKDLNVTASLEVMSIVLVEASGIRKKGVKGWIRSFAEPIPIIAPINVLELFIRPLSLCMRLFGNVLGAVVVMALIKYLLPLVVPLPFSGYFDIFDGVIQSYVFVFLTSLYI